MKILNRRKRQEAPEPRGLVRQVNHLAQPLRTLADLDPLLDRIGNARFVLLGEASHGTADYYLWRTWISQRLIAEEGFSFIGVEGDWPDCYEVNRYVKGQTDGSARETLQTFRRWPTWMWANEEIVTLAEWLRKHNRNLPQEKQAGFYGLDVYSLWDSLFQIMAYLGRVDPSALEVARRAYQCFEPHGEDVQEYARSTYFVPAGCREEVIALLKEIRRKAGEYQTKGCEEYFRAEQNAHALRNAEAYYRAMLHGGPESWNIRDHHMMDTLDRLMRYHGPDAKAIVWAHNTHVGDARYTDMADEGMSNLGQMTREWHEPEGVVLVGFGSHRGRVVAGKEWGAPKEVMAVPEAREGSWEDVLHRAGAADKLLIFDKASRTSELIETRGHRAIGVVYRPDYERFGNYVPTSLPRRYDAFLFLDHTQALHPLPVMEGEESEVPETYPTGV